MIRYVLYLNPRVWRQIASACVNKTVNTTIGAIAMPTYDLDRLIIELMNEKAEQLEDLLSASVLAYFGNIHPAFLRPFRDVV